MDDMRIDLLGLTPRQVFLLVNLCKHERDSFLAKLAEMFAPTASQNTGLRRDLADDASSLRREAAEYAELAELIHAAKEHGSAACSSVGATL
jgi:hypothetical protein